MIDKIKVIFKILNLPINTNGKSYKLLSDFCNHNLDKDYDIASVYFMEDRNRLWLAFKDDYLYHNYCFIFDTNVVNSDLLTFIEYIYVGTIPVALVDNFRKRKTNEKR